MSSFPTRRTVLAGFGACMLGLPVCQSVRGQEAGSVSPVRLRAIGVDTSRIAALGNPAGADILHRALAAQMRAVFGDLLAPREGSGGMLLARIHSVYLAPFAGGRAFNGVGSGNGNDTIEGVGVLSSGGRVVSETPILTVLDPGYSGAWYLPDIDARRFDSIAHQFAWWLRREMGV